MERRRVKTRPPKRKEEILAVASSVMREKGLSQTRLQDVADRLGVAYTALYYYFPNRAELTGEVLAWNIRLRAAQLNTASGNSALERLEDLLIREIVEDRSQKVRIPPPSNLPSGSREAVSSAIFDFTCQLVKLLETGIAEGSIRRCDPLIVANILIHTLEYFVGFDERAPLPLRDAPIDDLAQSVTDIFRKGILADRSRLPEPGYRIMRGNELLAVNPDVDDDIHRLEQIYRTATRHFNIEGFQASITRIAEELGLSKSLILKYFIDEEELLFRCYERGANVVESSHRIAAAFSRNSLDEMLIHHDNLFLFHASEAGPFALINAMDDLKPQHQRMIMLKNHGVRQMSVRRMRRAISDGYVRPDVDPDIVQAIVGSALYGLPSWYDAATVPASIEDISRQILMLHYQGLSPPDT